MNEAKAEPPKRRRWYLHAEAKVYGPYDQATIGSMIASNQILSDDKVQIEGGSVWIDAEREPTLGPMFRKHSKPIAEPPARKGRGRLGWVRFIPAAVFLLIVVWIAWPYYALLSLVSAVQSGDVPTLERRVDWVSVRQAIRGDLNASLLQNLTGKKGDTSDAMASGFAAMLGPAVINNLIDGYVTPQAIAALVRNESKAAPSNDDDVSSNNIKKAVSQARGLHWEQVKFAFFSGSPLSFEVDILPPNDPPLKAPVNLIFNWSGDWRLVRVNLPPEILDRPTSATNKKEAATEPRGLLDRPKTNSSQTQAKPVEPSPIELRLLTKTFKAANPKASEYQSAIQFGLSLTNTTAQAIRAFDGVLTFTDLLDNEIFSTKLAINDPIGPGLSMNWNGVSKYNEFIDSHERFKNSELANLKTKFLPRKILYADGSTKVFD